MLICPFCCTLSSALWADQLIRKGGLVPNTTSSLSLLQQRFKLKQSRRSSTATWLERTWSNSIPAHADLCVRWRWSKVQTAWLYFCLTHCSCVSLSLTQTHARPLTEGGWAMTQFGAPSLFPSATVSSYSSSGTNTALWWQFRFFSPLYSSRINKLILTKFRQKASYLFCPLNCPVLFSSFSTGMMYVLHVFILLSKLYLKMMWLFLGQFPPWWPRMSNTWFSYWIILWSEVCYGWICHNNWKFVYIISHDIEQKVANQRASWLRNEESGIN